MTQIYVYLLGFKVKYALNCIVILKNQRPVYWSNKRLLPVVGLPRPGTGFEDLTDLFYFIEYEHTVKFNFIDNVYLNVVLISCPVFGRQNYVYKYHRLQISYENMVAALLVVLSSKPALNESKRPDY